MDNGFMPAISVKFYGIVQGIGFRAHVRKKARELGVTGWVKNNDDGSVEAVFNGSEEMLAIMLAYCRKIPMAQISSEQITDLKEMEFKGFN
ncbi:MAG: acylphosphatase [Ferroplasma sp.]